MKLSKKKLAVKKREKLLAASKQRKQEQKLEKLRGPLFSKELRDAEYKTTFDPRPNPSQLNDGRNSHLKITSGSISKKNTIVKKETYTGELAEREAIAQKEIERKKKRIAPAYNKGGYQYITDETDLSDLGRKK